MAAAPPTRQNNFDLLRLAAAIAVVVSHAFPLGEGLGTPEPLAELSGHQASLGGTAVIAFMALSGYLVSGSAARSTLRRFLQARVLRIYPALITVVVGSVVVLGPAFTDNRAEYLQPETLRYVVNITGVQVAYSLPGVFQDNPYPNAVNGSLWTLEYELAMYALVAIALAIGALRMRTLLPLWVLAAAATALAPREPWAYFTLAFLSGATVYLGRVPIRGIGAALAGLAVGATLIAGVGFNLALATAGTYLLLWLALATPPTQITTRIGDLSYGTYLWAFPVQQCVAHFTGPALWFVNLAIALPITLVIAGLSWHLVERPALRFKDRAPGRLGRLVDNLYRERLLVIGRARRPE